MKMSVKHLVMMAALAAAGTLPQVAPGAEQAALGRYAIIVERRPFGAEALPVVEPPPPPVPPEQSIVNQFRLSAVVRDDAGVLRVGLVELKSNRNYILGIGESVSEVEVISADYAAEKARLRRGPEEYWVSMQGGSNRFERVTPESLAAPAAPTGGEAKSEAKERVMPNGVDQQRSYVLRRQQREEARLRKELERMRALEEERAKALAARGGAEGGASGGVAGIMRAGRSGGAVAAEGRLKVDKMTESEQIDLTDEEVGKLLQEYQKELIRKGLTPLPIPLTPETDRELVEEGLLPAQR